MSQAAYHPSQKIEARALKNFENLCESYISFRRDQEEAKQAADELKAIILADVERYGFVPTNAEKSRRIETPGFIATISTGTTIEINDSRVFDLELLLSRARCPKLFASLFTRRVEYSLAKTAAVAMQTTAWPKKHADEIRSLYGLCFTPKPKTPSLEVLSREEVAERERVAAEKAAAKSAKKSRGKAAA
jgi:hypothetical protein